MHSLVGAKESHELRCLDGFDGTNSVDIEVTPSFVEVGIEISAKCFTFHLLVGFKNLGASSSSSRFVQEELTVWLAFTIIIACLTFKGVGAENRSHEEIITTGLEMSWDNSFVSTIEGLTLIENSVEITSFSINLSESGFIRISAVGLRDGVVTICLLSILISSVLKDRSKRPNGSVNSGSNTNTGGNEFH